MSVDLHRIGTGISSGTSRNGFGNIVSFPSVSGFPAAGTFNSWLYDVEYPIANGGADLIDPYNIESPTPSQFCDVQVENDGSGGTYTDWTTATDIQYFANGTVFRSTSANPYINYITISGGNYQNGTVFYNYVHNGSGGWTETAVYDYLANGIEITQINQPATLDISTYYNGTQTVVAGTVLIIYYSNGIGGYEPSTGNTYNWYDYGVQIYTESYTFDGVTSYYNYYSDDNGSYYSESGSY
jgi:hypothetical protein